MTASTWLILLLGVGAILAAVLGYVKGFLKMVIPVAAFVLAILAVVFLWRPVRDYVEEKTNWEEQLTGKIEEIILEKIPAGEGIGSVIDKTQLPDSIRELIKNEMNEAIGPVEEWSGELSGKIADKIIAAGVCAALFILSYILLLIIGLIIIKVSDLPGLKTTDKVLGLILALLWYVCGIEMIGLVLMLIAMTPAGEAALAVVHESEILTFIYDHNIFVMALEFFIGKQA